MAVMIRLYATILPFPVILRRRIKPEVVSSRRLLDNAVHPPGDVGGTKMHRTRGHDTARTGAARAVWLGVHAPRLRLQGSWWQMEWHAANRTSVSEQLTRGFDEPETLRQLWRYCEKVYACLSRSQVRLTEEQARVRVHLLLRAPLGCAAAPG